MNIRADEQPARDSCACMTWARVPDETDIALPKGIPVSRHHHNCPEYKPTAWACVTLDGSSCIMHPDDAKARQKSAAARAKAEEEVRRRTHFAVRDAIAKQGLAADDIKLIAQSAYDRLWNEFRKTIAGWWQEIPAVATTPSKPAKKSHTDHVAQLSKRIASMTGTEAMQLLMDCALVSAVLGFTHSGGGTKADLAAAAKRYRIDEPAIAAAVKAEADAKKKPAAKAKPAKKIVPVNELARQQIAANAAAQLKPGPMITPVITPLIKTKAQ